jgi:hypothetical protein
LKSPISDALLSKKFLAHLLDSLDLLVRINSSLLEGITHASALADVFSDSINKTEFRGEVEVVLSDLNEEEGLVRLLDTHAIMLFKILSHTNLLILECEGHSDGTVSEVHVVDGVRSAVTPVGNDDLLAILRSHS